MIPQLPVHPSIPQSLEAAGHEAGSGMYPVYSMANHSCAASAMAVVGGSDGGYELQLRAQVPIRKVTHSPSASCTQNTF